MANQIFRIKHGMDVAEGKLIIAASTGNMTVDSALQANSTITAGAKLTVSAGGADVNGLLTAKNNMQVDGNLTVAGTTTTVNSTTVTVADPVFQLGSNAADDNLDRGISFLYNDGSAKIGFMGYDDSDGKFKFLTGATENGNVFSGTDGTIVATIEGNASTATALAAAGTLSLTAGDINAVSDASANGNYSLAVTIANNAITFAKMQDIASMKVVGNVTGGSADPAEVSILDEDNMASNSATALATQQSIKAYIDTTAAGVDSIAEQTDTEISGIAQAHMLIWDHDQSRWENKALSGDVTMTKEGVSTIGAGAVDNAMLANSGVTITAGDALTGGGAVVLGGTVALAVGVDGSSIETNSDALRVKAGGITDAMLAGSIADGKLAQNYIQTSEVDGASIEFDSGSLNVKADGITDAMINWGTAATQVSTADVPEQTNLYYTDARVHTAVSAVDAGGDGSFSETNGVFTYTGPSAAEARAHVSAATSGDGSLAYNSGTGVFTYVGPSAAEHRAHLSAGTDDGLAYNSGTGDFTLSQSIKSGATPTFAGLTITGNLAIAGTTTTVNSATMEVVDSVFILAKNNGANLTDIGFAAPFNDGAAKFATFFRDANDSGKWKLAETTQSDISTTNSIDTTNAGWAAGTLVANLEGATAGVHTGAVTGDVTGTVSSIANHDTGDLSEGSNLYYTDARVFAAVSAVDAGGDGSFSETNGVFTYTGPSAAEARAHLSATAPMAYNSTTGVISIAADTDDVTEAGNLYYTDARVRLNRLDQMAAPTAAVALNAQKITGLADGAAAQDAVTKAQLDAVAAGTSMGGLTDTTISNPADAHVVIYDNGASKWENQVMTGDVTMTKEGVTSIGATKITDAMIIGAGLANSSLANTTVAFGGVSLALGAADTTPAFNLSDATALPTTALTGTVTNAQLANSTISGKALGTNLDALTDGNGIADFTFNGSGAASIALELASANALEVGAGGVDLKSTIAGARTFSAKLTASAGVDTGSETSTSGAYTMTAAAEQVANTFAHATFRSAKYVAQVTNQAGSEYQCSELLVVHNGTVASVAEYGLMHTGAAALATFDVGINGANVELKATAGNGDVIKFSRSTLVI